MPAETTPQTNTTTAAAEAARKPLAERLQEKLGGYVALSTAIIAAAAGISSLAMARHSGKATAQLVESADQWSFYQSKSIKSYIVGVERNQLSFMIVKPEDAERLAKTQKDEAEKLAKLDKEKDEIMANAKALSASSKRHSALGGMLGNAVTLFQIAIANMAIAALSKRVLFWMVGLGLGLGGLAYVGWYLLMLYNVVGLG